MFNAEYGTQGIVSTSGDVYSFGIMLLEMYTRKSPTDEMFGGEIDLKSWVNHSLHQNKIIEVVDANLVDREDTDFSAKEECVSSILALATECVEISPLKRFSRREIVSKLEKIRTVLLANSSKLVANKASSLK